MPTKITVIDDHPQDPDAFEAAHPEQLALAAKLPGIDGVESSTVWPKEDGTPTPAYRLLDLYLTDHDTANDAAASAEAGAFFPNALALATGGVRIVFADVERVTQPAGAIS